MTLTFVPPRLPLRNNARPASLHPSPDRINHPSPLFLLADDAQLGQGGDELGGRGVSGQQRHGAGGGGEDGDQEDFAGHETNLSAASFSVSTTVRNRRWTGEDRSAS